MSSPEGDPAGARLADVAVRQARETHSVPGDAGGDRWKRIRDK